jgi:DNA-binding transcriptional LysR family regulator
VSFRYRAVGTTTRRDSMSREQTVTPKDTGGQEWADLYASSHQNCIGRQTLRAANVGIRKRRSKRELETGCRIQHRHTGYRGRGAVVFSRNDIFNMPLLHMTSRVHLWRVFQATIPDVTTRVQKGSYFDQFSLVIAAAVSGMGAAILPTYLIETELGSGALIQLANVEDSSGHNYYIATPPGELSPPAAEFLS